MKTKTIREYDVEAFDKACNIFNADHNVKFSQTHYCREYDKKELEVFVMIIFYDDGFTSQTVQPVKPVQAVQAVQQTPVPIKRNLLI